MDRAETIGWLRGSTGVEIGAVDEVVDDGGGGGTATRSHEGHMVRVVGGVICM